MGRLREQIEKVLHKFSTAENRQARAGRRWLKNHDKAVREHKKAVAAERAANKAKKQGHPKLAEAEAGKAARCHHRAYKAKLRADHYVGKAKEFAAEARKLDESLEVKKAKLKKLEERGVHRDGNRIKGGSPKDRLSYAMHYSMLHGSQFYSQIGTLQLKDGLTGPPPGCRHDCSSWAWSMLYAAGIPDPTGGNYEQNVWTGNEAETGHSVRESELDTGCAVFYGTAPFHHVEMKDGPIAEGDGTVGHGSPPIDRGVVALLPGPRSYRRYIK